MDCSVVFESKPGVSRKLESVAIRSDEAIAFGGSFLWIKLGGLAHDLDEGDRIPVTLHFLNGFKVTILVPVEPAPVGRDRHWLRLL